MEDLLHGRLAVRKEQIHTLTTEPAATKGSRESLRELYHESKRCGVNVLEERSVVDWYNQQVSRIHGTNVHEHRTAIIAVEECARRLTCKYPAENAACFVLMRHMQSRSGCYEPDAALLYRDPQRLWVA